MNIFQQLFLQTIFVGAALGSFVGVLLVAIGKGLYKLAKFLINKAKE